MTVDRGGLRYAIRIEDQFQKPLDDFTAGIRRARTELQSLRSASSRLRTVSNDVARSNDRITRSVKSQSTAIKDLNKRQGIRAAAIKQQNALDRKAAVSQEKARVASVRRFATERRLLTVAEARAKAEADVTREQNRRLVAEQQALVRAQRGLTVEQKAVKVKKELTLAERELAAAKKRTERAALAAGNAQIQELNAQAAAARRLAAIRTGQRTASILQGQGVDVTADPTTGALRAANAQKKIREEEGKTMRSRIANLRTFGLASKTAGGHANRAAFTFRRLFGILAAFAAARAVVSGFRAIVNETIRFQAAVEQSTLGVATLITAAFDVRDAFGGSVTAAQKLALAQGVARQQIVLLRKDALRTVATFEQLLSTFQVALAPGAKAGLDLDQIRKFTFDISNAAAAIGLEQNQLAEEIRSLLEGTIQARTTRIAVALGITNEDIRLAKEAGVLFDFLQDRFSAFAEASGEVQKTFNALLTNLVAGFQEVLAAGGIEFFEEVKNVLKDLFDLVATEDDLTNTLRVNPQVVGVVNAFTDALTRALRAAREVASSLNFDDLQGLASNAGEALVVAARVLLGIVKGFVQGAKDLLGVLIIVGRKVADITGLELFGGDLSDTAAVLTRILVIIVGLQVAMGIISGITGVLGLLWGAVGIAVAAVNAGLTAMAIIIAIIEAELVIPLLVLIAIVAVVVKVVALFTLGVVLLKKWLSAVTGIQLKWITFAKVVKSVVVNAFKIALANIERAWIVTTRGIAGFFASVIGGALSKILGAVEDVLSVLEHVGLASEEWTQSVRELRQEVDAISAGTIIALGDEIDEANKKVRDATSAFAVDLASILANAENDPTLGEAAGDLGQYILEKVMEGMNALGDEIDKILADSLPEPEIDFDVQGARDLNTVLDAMPGIIQRSREGLSAQVELVKELKEEVQKANDELREGVDLLGVSGPVARQRTAALKAENTIRDKSTQLVAEQTTAAQELADIRGRAVANERRLRSLSEQQTAALNEGLALARTRNELANQEAQLAKEIDLQTRLAQAAEAEGDEDGLRLALAKLRMAELGLRVVQRQQAAERESAEALFERNRVEQDGQAAVLDGIERTIQLQGQELVVNERLQAIAEDRARIAGQINAALAARIELLARQQEFEAGEETRNLAEEARVARQQQLAESQLAGDRRLTESQSRVDAINFETEAIKRRNARELEQLDILIAQLAARQQILQTRVTEATTDENKQLAADQLAATSSALSALEAQREATLIRNNGQLELQSTLLSAATDEVERAQRALDKPFSFGILEGIRQAAIEAPDLFQGTVDVMKNTIQAFGNFVASTISDAFDPTKDVNLRQRFAQFLQGIASQIISMLVQVAIVKAILVPFLGASTGGQISIGGVGFGAFKGGRVGNLKPHKATYGFQPAHAYARGFAKGGPTTGAGVAAGRTSAVNLAKTLRPPGLDPRDTIPVWAAKDEFIIRAKAVKMYGSDVMDAVNRGLVDPGSLRAIANVNKQSKGVTRRRAGGFAEGGQIRPQDAAQVAAAAPSGGTTVAPILADDDLMQQLLNGGNNALRQWMRAEGYDNNQYRARNQR